MPNRGEQAPLFPGLNDAGTHEPDSIFMTDGDELMIGVATSTQRVDVQGMPLKTGFPVPGENGVLNYHPVPHVAHLEANVTDANGHKVPNQGGDLSLFLSIAGKGEWDTIIQTARRILEGGVDLDLEKAIYGPTVAITDIGVLHDTKSSPKGRPRQFGELVTLDDQEDAVPVILDARDPHAIRVAGIRFYDNDGELDPPLEDGELMAGAIVFRALHTQITSAAEYSVRGPKVNQTNMLGITTHGITVSATAPMTTKRVEADSFDGLNLDGDQTMQDILTDHPLLKGRNVHGIEEARSKRESA